MVLEDTAFVFDTSDRGSRSDVPTFTPQTELGTKSSLTMTERGSEHWQAITAHFCIRHIMQSACPCAVPLRSSILISFPLALPLSYSK